MVFREFKTSQTLTLLLAVLMKTQALDMTGHVRATAYSKLREMVEGL